MTNYDKELINSRISEVCDYYLPGEGKHEGYKRLVWGCPDCGAEKFTVNTERGIAGCFSAGCGAPRTTDAVGLIAYFEGLELRGEQFVRCLEQGYEILGVPEPDDGFHKQRSSTARSTASAEGTPVATQGEGPE